jgi:PAS domain S-box-containing protein
MSIPIPVPSRWQRFVVGGGVFAVLFGTAAALLILFYAHKSAHDRELLTWQVRESAVAERQAAAIQSWIDHRFAGLQALADNASLQIYLTELAQGSRGVTEAAAQRQYLSELLDVTATRSGFAAHTPPPTAVANENAPAHAGLAIFGSDMRPIVTTFGMSWLVNALGNRLRPQQVARRELIDALSFPDGGPAVGFIEPIFAVDSDGAANHPVGYVVGTTSLNDELFTTLAIDAPYPNTAVSTLVRAGNGMVEYLSPDLGASKPSYRRVSATTATLDAAFDAANPGAFAEKRDFHGTPVLTTGRAIAGTPWTVVHSVPVDAAMADADARVRYLVLIVALGASLAVAAVLVVWRHGATRRLTDLAADYKRRKEFYEKEHERLELVADAQPDVIVIVDGDGRISFANRAFRDRVGISHDAILGKRLDALLGPAASAPWLNAVARAGATGSDVRDAIASDRDGSRRAVELVAVPLATHQQVGATLVVERDVTEMLAERERREQRLSHLVAALTAAVDLRDPTAAHQSERVAMLARGVARELHADDQTVEAAEMTGRLLNFGKMLVPPELLTREGPLTADELKRVRLSLAETAQILSGAGCDGAVVEALSAFAEQWNGNEPYPIDGPKIPIAAQIVAAANFFVGAASVRAYRERRGVDYAMAELQAESGKSFDRRIVSALMHFVDNGGGKALFAAETTDD